MDKNIILNSQYNINIMQFKKKRWHCLPGQTPTEMDLKIMELEKKGKLVPTRNLIRTPEEIRYSSCWCDQYGVFRCV